MATYPYRVRSGHVLPHEGTEYEAGQVVQLPRHVAREVRHAVEPINAAGEVVPEPTDEEIELESRPAHEHVSILQRRRAERITLLADLREIAARTAATAAAAQREVDRVTAEIVAIEAQVAAPASAAPAVATPSPRSTDAPRRAPKAATPPAQDSTTTAAAEAAAEE